MMRRPRVAPRVACIAIAAILGIVVAARPASAVEPGEWGRVKNWFFPGDPVILTLKDSTRVAGAFQGLARIPLDDYRPRYDQWRASVPDASRMPDLGTRVELVGFGMSNFARGSFEGFSQEAVDLQKKPRGPIRPVQFNHFKRLVIPRGGSVKRQQLEQWSRAGGLPRSTELVVGTAEGPRTVPLDDVAGVRAPGFAPSSGLGRFADRVIPVGATALELGFSRFYGLSAADVTLRLFPMGPGALGPDVAISYMKFEPGWLLAWDLASAVTIPVGRYAGIEPRIGGGLLYGEGSAAITGNLGVGMFALFSRNEGLRIDCGSRFGLWGLEGLSGVPFSVQAGFFKSHL